MTEGSGTADAMVASGLRRNKLRGPVHDACYLSSEKNPWISNATTSLVQSR
ncbi:MAG: hypothetical protein GXP26_05110 [Planctomycetes bacterium]|nr:hypothetical protein [Planctomycetota bacterium]